MASKSLQVEFGRKEAIRQNWTRVVVKWLLSCCKLNSAEKKRFRKIEFALLTNPNLAVKVTCLTQPLVKSWQLKKGRSQHTHTHTHTRTRAHTHSNTNTPKTHTHTHTHIKDTCTHTGIKQHILSQNQSCFNVRPSELLAYSMSIMPTGVLIMTYIMGGLCIHTKNHTHTLKHTQQQQTHTHTHKHTDRQTHTHTHTHTHTIIK